MSLRAMLTKIPQTTNLVRPILIKPNQYVVRSQPKSTTGRGEMYMFTAQGIKKYWEVIPLLVIVGAGVVGLVYASVRSALTRDDVRYNNKSKMLCEIIDTDESKIPKPRKFLVYNQKYETPSGLIEAGQALKDPATEAN
ncbi:uncharacterized protein LOC119681046 [Teleopsis dalmanni]|uniref:uncharacterized protein LOC119681046 n=1 Tax=Teleopsis dalmanni TaxID=139649 RepID=UPI0018CCE821|nr:uncharacterized protein LOC119681046 [Teleopsis dalmanni]